MISQRQSHTLAGEPGLGGAPIEAPGLVALTTAVRAAVGKHANWRDTAQLVAATLERHLPSPKILTAEQRAGDSETYKSEVQHAEPDGSFSIVPLVRRPGRVTPIHEYVTWCAFGVIQGIEWEELLELDEQRTSLVEAGYRHRVRNAGDLASISIHTYGTDVTRIGSSVRRNCDLPVQPLRPAA